MSYQTDYAPIEYLERRIKYYKKLRGKYRTFDPADYMIKKYGRKFLKEAYAKAVIRYQSRVDEYSKAIEILKNNNHPPLNNRL